MLIADSITLIDGHVTVPQGYLATGLHCGIRADRKDLGLIYSTAPVYRRTKPQRAYSCSKARSRCGSTWGEATGRPDFGLATLVPATLNSTERI